VATDVFRAVLGSRQAVQDGVVEVELRHRPDDGRDGLELGLRDAEGDDLSLCDQAVEALEVLPDGIRREDLADLGIVEQRAHAVQARGDRGAELGVELRRLGLEPELDRVELVLLLARADALLGQLHVVLEGLVGGGRAVERGHRRLAAVRQPEDADDLGREVLRFLVPERVGERRPLDVLDHVGDVAAQGGSVEIRTADDVPLHAAREAHLVVVAEPARERALVPHEVGVVSLGVDDEPAHLPGRIRRVQVDELRGEGVLRG
jgi:hypothetical protein